MSLPPMMWGILALGVLWLLIRVWSGRAEERRRAAHEERMARLLEERAERAADHEPHSLAALTSDPPHAGDARDAASGDAAKDASDAAGAPGEAIKIRCRACRALNDERASHCAQCGLEL